MRLEVRTLGYGFADHVRTGVEDGLAIRAHDGGVVNHRPVTLNRFQHCIEIKVGCQIVGGGAPDFRGVAGVNVSAGKIRDFGGGDVGEFRIQVVGGVVCARNPLTQYVRNIDVGK
jgi:hypothetical protein